MRQRAKNKKRRVGRIAVGKVVMVKEWNENCCYIR